MLSQLSAESSKLREIAGTERGIGRPEVMSCNTSAGRAEPAAVCRREDVVTHVGEKTQEEERNKREKVEKSWKPRN